MTREQQITQASQGRFPEWGEQQHALELAFQAGCHWADSHPHWISVEDELPKNRELVFITDCESADMGFYDYTDDAWQPFEKWLGNITHWMPLPSVEHLKDREL